MSKEITGSNLIHIGYKEGKILGIALSLLGYYQQVSAHEVLALLKKVKDYPESFLDDPVLNVLAKAMIEEASVPPDNTIALSEQTNNYAVYGADYIEEGARTQMDIAMKLPVTVAGALMPDAHQGYGLPIGGVLATKNAIIPYGVGVDIGCRMAFPSLIFLKNISCKMTAKFKRELIAHTKFGAGAGFHGQDKADHAVLENKTFNMTAFHKKSV